MKYRKIRCKNCGNYFYPNSYNRYHQRYCSGNECRKVSRRSSSKKYREKQAKCPEYRQKESVRVQQWQAANPDYWHKRHKTSKKFSSDAVLRDFAQVQNLQSEVTVLRDSVNSQYHVIEGLIITLTGDVLRDNIGAYIRRMYDKSLEVSGNIPEKDFIMQLKRMRTKNGKQDVNRSPP